MSPSATSPPNRRHRDDGGSARQSTRRRSAVLLGPTHFPAVRSFGLRFALVVAPHHRRKQRRLHYACRPTSVPRRRLRRRRLRSIISVIHLPILRPFYLRYILAAAASGPLRRHRKDTLVGMGSYISRLLGKSSSHGFKAPPADDTAKEDLREVFTPLTNEEESEVNNILYGSDQSKKIIVVHGPSNIDITREKIWCLRTRNWLNDEVINLYLELLKERAQREPKRFLKCHFFNTFFYKKLACGKTGYDYQSVRRWTTLNRLGYGLDECEKIFVPVHRNVHWCLAIINMTDRTFQYLDSLGGMDHAVLNILVSLADYKYITRLKSQLLPFTSVRSLLSSDLRDASLDRYIRDELNDKSNKQVDTGSWLKISDSCPLQQNWWDCGMFMLKFIDFHSRGIGLCFTQEHMDYFRKRTAKEILRLRAD
uniref:Ubiquitin-like protease family profile domain-containing protein n=1 Tax=Oryza punctata TaxID=4537 RepID=A0A0E0KEY3_ORYPU